MEGDGRQKGDWNAERKREGDVSKNTAWIKNTREGRDGESLSDRQMRGE